MEVIKFKGIGDIFLRPVLPKQDSARNKIRIKRV